MKILFFSDIHGIETNLSIIENKIKEENIDKLVCLGDLYYRGPLYKGEVNNQAILDFLNKYKNKLICMRGNCDSSVDIKVCDFPVCDGMSLINIDNLEIYVTHGHEYSINKKPKLEKGILIYGHEHTPYIKEEEDIVYICIGSISLPRNNFKPSYAIYNNRTITIYDIYNNIIEQVELS